MSDEQAIRDLIHTWMYATGSGDFNTILSLLSEDVVFHTTAGEPFGKKEFAEALRQSSGKVKTESVADIKEVEVSGDLAVCRVFLSIKLMTQEGILFKRFSGYSMSVLRKREGKWLIVRDANFVKPERAIHATVPVLQVKSVKQSITWYRNVLGFAASPFGPEEEPVFAILQRDGVEMMLQNNCEVHAGEGMSVYIRVGDIDKVREAVRTRIPEVGAIITREYNCREIELTDPDGHHLVLGECG